MGEIVGLKDANAEPDERVMDALEDALEAARRGELRSVYIVGSLTGNRTLASFGTHDMAEGIGLATFLAHTLCAKMRENVE